MEIHNIKESKDALKEMEKFMKGEKSDTVPDARAFGNQVIEMLKFCIFTFESIQRDQGPSSAFIDSSEIPHRLR